jgi:hypothetical protein
MAALTHPEGMVEMLVFKCVKPDAGGPRLILRAATGNDIPDSPRRSTLDL